MVVRSSARAVGRSLVWFPRVVRREFRTRGGDKRFLMWVSFLLMFTWARLWVEFFGTYAPHFNYQDQFQFGQKTVVAGYHPHHIFTGIVLLAIAGWLAIHYGGKQLNRVVAVMYGSGLGLIVDEIGFIIEGFTYRDDFPEVFVFFVVVGALLMSGVYFPQFWASLEARVKWAWRRHERSDRPRRSDGSELPVTQAHAGADDPSGGERPR